MIRKTWLIICALVCCSMTVYGQKLKIKSFNVKTMDISARTHRVTDANGDTCALIKLISADKVYGVKEFHLSNAIDRQERTVGESAIYLPMNTKKTVIRHETLGKLEFVFPEPLKKETTYEMVLTIDYGGTKALLRSMIVPGWGQMYKQQKGKGVTILCAEAVAVAGIFVCHNQYNNYRDKAIAEHSSKLRQEYMDKSDTWGNFRNGFIIGASAIYVYNIVDVLTSKGRKGDKTKKVSLNPYWDMDNNAGVSLSLNF